MIATICTFVSVIIAIITIAEMRIERGLAYEPAIVLNPIEVEFSWDSSGYEEWLKVSEQEGTVTPEGGTINFSINVLYDGSFDKFAVVNIGEGVAQNLCFSWDENNMNRFTNCLTCLDRSKENFCYIDKSIVMDYDANFVTMDKEMDSVLMYLLPHAETVQPLSIPPQYTILTHEIIKTGKYNSDLLYFLYVDYDDIQGKHYHDKVAIKVKKTFFMQNDDGSGNATYQFIPQIVK